MILGTRKGLVTFRKSKSGKWKFDNVSFLGEPVSLAYVDKKSGNWWACLDHGHWGVKLHKSIDQGRNWIKVEAPKYPEGMVIKGDTPASTRYLWSMTNGGNASDRLYIGTEPGGLFQSDDGGESFHLIDSLWNHPSREEKWFGGGRDHPGIHSIIVDPRNSDHIYVGISVAGVFESVNGGKTWEPKNKGLTADFLPDPFAEVGQDPHLLVACESNPDYLWQQNHCGIFKSENAGELWEDVSEKKGPAYFGFAIAVDSNDPQIAWVVPGVSDQTRVAVDRSLCVCRTIDGGSTWQKLNKGLPKDSSFDITYRHALDIDMDVVAFGTTTGNLYLSNNKGDDWETISNNLPMVYSLDFIE